MELTKSDLRGTGFNGVLASVWEYNKNTKEFLFTKNSLLMFGLKGVFVENVWYQVDDKLFKHVFSNQINNFYKIIEFLEKFDSEVVVDFKMKLEFKVSNESFYLEGFNKNEIVFITAIGAVASPTVIVSKAMPTFPK